MKVSLHPGPIHDSRSARPSCAAAGLIVSLLMVAGCSSRATYPKQVITVLPPSAESTAQYPSSAGEYAPPEHPGREPAQIPGAVYPRMPERSGAPGEARPQVPGEVSPPPGPGAPPETTGQSHYNQGVLLFRQGDVNGAIEQFRMAVGENPRDTKARNNLGVLLEKTGDTQGAMQQYRAALQVDPNNKLSHRLLARAMAQSGNIDGAIDQYETTVKLDPGDPGVHNDFGVALHRRGDENDAIYQYRKALALDPRDFAAHRNLADALNETGDTAQAIKELRIADQLHPDDPIIHNALGNLLFEQNDLSASMAQWQEANRLDPRNPDALAGMSIGYWKMGLKRQAMESYRQAVALAPGYLCDDAQLRTQGHWNGPALSALHDIAKAPGAPRCTGI